MIRRLIAASGIVLPLILLAWGPPEGLSAEGHKALSLALFAIPFFLAETIPVGLTGLILLLLFVLLGVVSPGVAFSGFTTPAFWLVFSAFLLGGGMLRTGLARRMAFVFIRALGNRFDRVLMGFCVLGFLLTFGVPSANARVALLIPIALEIGSAFGLELRSRGCAALVLATTMSAFFPGFAVLTANVPNLVHVAVVESVSGASLSYGQWAYLHLPVLGLVRVALIFLTIRIFLWPKEILTLQSGLRVAGSEGPLSLEERKMIGLLCVAVGLWVTDFLHGLKPAWVGLGAAVATLLPGIGVLKEKDMGRHLNLPFLIYLASIFGLGTTLAATGVSQWAGEIIFRVVPLAEMGDALQVAVLAVITLLLGILTTHPAIPAVLTPIVITYAAAEGLDVNRLLMAEILGFSISFFPYQTPPMVTAQGFGAFSGQQALRVQVPFAFLSLVVVIPLTILYWKAIAFLP
ncbi:MAG: SLC13 family permease [Nitrospinota bacterium]